MALLNKERHAYELWKWMMKSGEEYIKFALQKKPRFAMQAGANRPDHSHLIV